MYSGSVLRSLTALTTDWYRPIPEYVPDHFRNSNNSSQVHALPTTQISWKPTYNFSSYYANKQTDKHGSKHCPSQSVAKVTYSKHRTSRRHQFAYQLYLPPCKSSTMLNSHRYRVLSIGTTSYQTKLISVLSLVLNLQ